MVTRKKEWRGATFAFSISDGYRHQKTILSMNKRMKTGGREKGTPNKITSDVKHLIADLVMSELEYIYEHRHELELIDRYRLACAMSRLIVPVPTKEAPYVEPPIIYIHPDL